MLKEEHRGVVAVEAMIMTPIMFMTFMLLLYIFFMVMSYMLYNNVANNIAQELNMRQTGYGRAMENYKTLPKIYTYSNMSTSDAFIDSGHYLSESNIKIFPESDALKSGVYYALDRNLNGFLMPFTEIKEISVKTTKKIDPKEGSKMVGAVISVEIKYTSFITSFGSYKITLPNIKATGYNIIS